MIHRTLRPVKARDAVAEREPLLRYDAPLAARLDLASQAPYRILGELSCVKPVPDRTKKPSTATHVPRDAGTFFPSTWTCTVCRRRPSPSNVTERAEAVRP